jgi:radical SAM superfamily enzyme YgiQ (UPF0313 family)
MISLINPPGIGVSCGWYAPLGLMYLAGNLKVHGMDCEIIDGNVDGWGPVIEAIKRKPEIVGIGVMSATRWNSFDVVAKVRELSPKTTVVLGGPHATLMPEHTQKFADIVIQGDAEQSFVDVCQGKEPSGPIWDMDKIPLPDWDKVNWKKYPGRGYSRFNPMPHNGIPILFSPRLGIVASRGCRASCRFCAFHVQGKYRQRSPSRVADEIEMLYAKGARHFCFQDDAWYLDREKGIEFCEEIVGRKLRIAFSVMTRAANVDEEFVHSLKAAGCYSMWFGVESGSPEILKSMHKSVTLDELKRAFHLCRKLKMRTAALMLIGYPGETDATIEDSRNFMRECNPSAMSSAGGLWIMPATAVYQQAKKKGLIDDSFWDTRQPFKVWEFSPQQIRKWMLRVHSYTPYHGFQFWFGSMLDRILRKLKMLG